MEPVPQRHPNGVLDARGRQELENGLLAERSIEAHLDRNAARTGTGIVDQLLQPRDRTL